MLIRDRDSLGMPRLSVDWRLSDFDIQSVVRSVEILSNAVSRAGVATVRIEPDAAGRIRIRAAVGSHHLGTTRMANSPALGVVDQNCRVFGVNNLYIAGPSVFPTSSFVNPTLTIVALAIRLADYLLQIRQ